MGKQNNIVVAENPVAYYAPLWQMENGGPAYWMRMMRMCNEYMHVQLDAGTLQSCLRRSLARCLSPACST